jgi:Glycosyl hydrolase catalytic core
VTEYAYAHRSVPEVHEHYNTTIEYFDESDFIGGYTYFGAFRSGVSNVGPDVTFLNNDGELTDVGSWYMGGVATGVEPQSGRGTSATASWGIILGMMGVAASVLV